MPPEHEQNIAAHNLIDDFEVDLKRKRLQFTEKQQNKSNFTRLQRQAIRIIKNHDDFIIFQCDKNLGPAVIERHIYIQRALNDHLNNKNVYQHLTEKEGIQQCKEVETLVIVWYNKYKHLLKASEQRFFKRFLSIKEYRISQFYITAKVHKSPWKTRPVVSTCGSILSYLSKWLDFVLTDFAKQTRCYIKDSLQVKNELSTIKSTKDTSLLYIADARSMYTMIDTDHALEVITTYLRTKHSSYGLIDPLIEALGIVMRNNIMKFGDSFYKQIDGTAMGTPVACVYATLYYACKELELFEKWSHLIIYLKRFIDDSIGIFKRTNNFKEEWIAFQADWPFGKLEWDFTTEETNNNIHQVDYMDITIYRQNNNLLTKTFEKKENLHLYIPKHTAHPPGILYGMVIGVLWRYKLQNSKTEDYNNMKIKFFQRLHNRGYTITSLQPVFKKAEEVIKQKEIDKTQYNINKLQQLQLQNQEVNNNDDTLFLHIRYHPRDLPRQAIRSLFNKNCMNSNNKYSFTNNLLDIQRIIVAFSKPRSLRCLICPSTLYEPKNLEVSSHYNNTTTTNNTNNKNKEENNNNWFE